MASRVASRDSLVGQTLGHYLITEKIGAGGMGEVYLAEHCLLRRLCAVKMIRPEWAGDPGCGLGSREHPGSRRRECVGSADGLERPPQAAAPAELLARIDDLSADQVDALLNALLNEKGPCIGQS